MNPIVKEYAWAAFVTFIVAFGGALGALDGSHFDQAAIFAVLAAGLREGGRAVINYTVTYFMNRRTTISSRPQ